jgi:uncharacterized protein (DUF58 family)
VGALTGRGRASAIGGLLLFGFAYALGDRDIARLGLVLLVVPLLCGLSVLRTRARLTSQRWLTAARVAAGEVVDVRIRLTNASRFATGVMLAEDSVPSAFGGRPRFVVDRLGGGARVEVHYPLRCARRGRYRLGPLTARVRDPFGLSELVRGFADVDEIVVTPAVEPLPSVPLTGEWAGLGESTRRSVATAGEDDAAIREYRVGDDLRRVHWRTTARRGELMVRREEQPWQSRAALLLDTRATVHTGDGPSSSLEWAVSAAASVGVHLLQRGFQLRLVYESGAAVTDGGNSHGFSDVLLDSLATCAPSRGGGLSAGLSALRHGGGEGLIVAVVGVPEMADVEAMIRTRGAGVTAVAILLDTAGWRRQPGGSSAARRTAGLLRGAGWRVVLADGGSGLAPLWTAAGARIGAAVNVGDLSYAEAPEGARSAVGRP